MAKNSAVRKIFESWNKFRNDAMLWHRFAENTCASFIYKNPPKKVRAAGRARW